MTLSTSSARSELYAKWARLIDTILPAPDENRLVSVAEVDHDALSLVEGSLAEIGVTPILSETRAMDGASRFRVLVPARDAAAAAEAVTGF